MMMWQNIFLHLKNQILGQDIFAAQQCLFIILVAQFTFIKMTVASAIWILHLAIYYIGNASIHCAVLLICYRTNTKCWEWNAAQN